MRQCPEAQVQLGSVASDLPGRQRLSQLRAPGSARSAPPGQQASSIRAASSASLREEHAVMCALIASSAMVRAAEGTGRHGCHRQYRSFAEPLPRRRIPTRVTDAADETARQARWGTRATASVYSVICWATPSFV